jgi:molybdate transport system substrate-binding protein
MALGNQFVVSIVSSWPPSAIQNYNQFAPGIVTGSSQSDAARALVTFLSSPAAQTVLKAKGFE